MPSSACELLGMYLHLARAAEARRRLLVRDKVLVLAAATAQEMQMPAVAEHCRRRVLAHNPGHLVGRHPTVAAALELDDFAGYVNHLRREFPLEKVEHMLQSLNISWDGERAAYYSDEEYAAAILGLTPAGLEAPPPASPPAAAQPEPMAKTKSPSRWREVALAVGAAGLFVLIIALVVAISWGLTPR